MPINFILLAVLSGIIGLVLTGFTLWHVYLAATGQTTIESLEKTRYLSPIRKSLQNHINGARNYVNGVPSPSYGQQLAEIHANALPGITRPEEGDATSPATASLRNNYNELQLARERDRYQDYLDEQASEKLPNAFDLGWRRNLMHVFGERRLLWLLPLCNTTGDGWTWEASKKWLLARERIAKERSHHESRSSQPDELDERAGFVNGSPGQHVRRGARRSRSSGQRHGMTDPARSGSPREIRAVDGWDGRAHGPPNELSNWNDIPEDMLNSRRGK
ncbi:MAG: palmitoyltransferase for Vac8p [Bathelium mastoideum]|nr:MAG: palmitoyltransferase for Vac8p [Bathelium mastoideum]